MADALSCMFHALRNHLSRTLALATLCTLGLVLATTPAFADDVITTIDISGKGSNTTVTIDKPGSYRLYGSNSTTWVHVKTGNVTLPCRRPQHQSRHLGQYGQDMPFDKD